jgi:hypothetical protein
MSAPQHALAGQQARQWTVLQSFGDLLAQSIGYIIRIRLGPEQFESQTLERVALGVFATRALAALAVSAAVPRQGHPS